MTNTHVRGRAGKSIAMLALLAHIATACDGILGSDQAAFADEARVIVEGSSPVPLLLITATNFTAVRDPETGEFDATLIAADTTVVSTFPIDQTEVISGWDRYLVRLVQPDITATADIQLRVLMDGQERYNQRALMRDASLQFILFFQP